ncbi:MAG: AI-2E family transporter, partial [Gemmatimonadetes bacterium]|nr:AI-2E family transporter [Gemmatimonadota bacterium]
SLMGRRLGLSPLVVVLSLVFWYFVWGPLGALLSVPLTMIVKIWLENTQDLRWLAVLIDKQAPDAAVAVAAPATASGVPPDDTAPDTGRPSRA